MLRVRITKWLPTERTVCSLAATPSATRNMHAHAHSQPQPRHGTWETKDYLVLPRQEINRLCAFIPTAMLMGGMHVIGSLSPWSQPQVQVPDSDGLVHLISPHCTWHRGVAPEERRSSSPHRSPEVAPRAAPRAAPRRTTPAPPASPASSSIHLQRFPEPRPSGPSPVDPPVQA
ncbi:hypothetical protein BGZ61DRAFT_134815 [Ilyonectria robusta]|uniref:uncharacterized protein n=1 Tax=Ilyonectria robusta TaxID=1079257 RepID=UPI001E8D9B1C|nr:uncharacterized protein BGZ61DRAFT_134815 [Ilyonectria robusta]KAH8735078.1 hypothetical protein BGZ61DRAFT_134815 [Ilyonectria robusta]